MELTEKGALKSAFFCVVSAFEHALARPSKTKVTLKNGNLARGFKLQGNR